MFALVIERKCWLAGGLVSPVEAILPLTPDAFALVRPGSLLVWYSPSYARCYLATLTSIVLGFGLGRSYSRIVVFWMLIFAIQWHLRSS